MVQKKSVSEESNIDYSHHSSVKDFQLVISGVIREDLICNVKNSDCFSLMFDESTDVSVSQNLIIYIRYLSVDKVSARVEPTTSFLAILIELNQHDLICNVKNSDCFSLMFDESTDVSVSQNLIIYIRYLSVDKVSARVEPTTSFLAILIELNQHIFSTYLV